MAKVFLHTCFATISPKQRPLPFLYSSSFNNNAADSYDDDEAASVFISTVLTDLHDLERSLGSVSLQWCRKAMILVRKMHSHFLFTFEKLFERFSSWDQANMMEEYLQESLDLLDLCNLLKSSISRFDMWRLMVAFGMKKPLLDVVVPIIEKVDSAGKGGLNGSKSFDIKKWMEKSLCRGAVAKTKTKDCRKLIDMIGAIQSAITMICFLVFSSVIQPVPIMVDPREICPKIQLLDSFSVSVQKLVSSFLDRFRFQVVGENQRLMLSEIEMVASAIEDFHVQMKTEQVATDKQRSVASAENLQRRSAALKKGLDLFETIVDEVFDDALKGRNMIIRLITSRTLTLK